MSEVNVSPTAAPSVNPSNPTGSGDSTQPQASNESTDASTPILKKYKVKVEGKDHEVTEEELLKGYSHGRAASRAMQEGKQLRKQAEEFIGLLKDEGKLWDVLQKLGHDPRILSEKYLGQWLEDQHMDPREKELRDAKSKIKAWEDAEKAKQEAVVKQRNEMLKAKYAQDFNKQFQDALDSSGLPKTKPMVAEMAKYIHRSAEMGYEITPQEAARMVKEDIQAAQSAIYRDMDGDALIQLIGEELANKVRKWDTSRIKTPEERLKTPQEQVRIERVREPGSKPSKKDWRKLNRS